jgi:hypothetical protein
MTVPNHDAEQLALPAMRPDIADQLERLRRMQIQLALVTRPVAEPAAAEEPLLPPRTPRRHLLRRRH